MNKLYSQITSLLVVVGLGTAWVFNLITLETLGTGATALLALIYGLYQKYEQSISKNKVLKLEDELKTSKNSLTNALYSKASISAKYDQLQKSVLKSELVTTELETPLEVVEKPKRKYYKSKKA